MSVRTARRWAIALAALSLAACGDQQVGADLLKPVQAGMPRDSLLALMGAGPLKGFYADTLRLEKGFRMEKYLIDGKMYEVLYYREAEGNVAEPVAQNTETPVVLQDGKVLGWGWKYYVETAMEELKLPTPIKEQPQQPAPAAEPAKNQPQGAGA